MRGQAWAQAGVQGAGRWAQARVAGVRTGAGVRGRARARAGRACAGRQAGGRAGARRARGRQCAAGRCRRAAWAAWARPGCAAGPGWVFWCTLTRFLARFDSVFFLSH